MKASMVRARPLRRQGHPNQPGATHITQRYPMSQSTLLPDLEEQPVTDRGHGTRALGPTDTSDSGSDITGGPGIAADGDFLELGSGTTSDLDLGLGHGSAGPDVGDADLSSDTDSSGTGETASAGRDTSVEAGADIGVDRIVDASELGITDKS